MVGLGGFIGAILRFLVGSVAQQAAGGPFPWGTLTVNAVGSLLLGLLAGLVESRGLFSPEMRLLLMTGILGAFTTFSTFSYETIFLWSQERPALALLNVVAQLVLGLGAAWVGYVVARTA
ncbi:MAG: fluoride efflux transporter CrcB [Candidatus Promineifilaceae bacterium]|nr:fluoride efflux transporter CrcB [Candidatus Promineifilaceae bacterium]